MPCQTMCNDCAFHIKVHDEIECVHPDESGTNCATVIFCSSFQPTVEVDSPCSSYGSDEAE